MFTNNKKFDFTNPLEVHVSSLATYSACRRLYMFTDKSFLNLEPIFLEIPYFRGRLAHYALEHYYSSNRNPQVMFQKIDEFVKFERELYDIATGFDETVDLMKEVLAHYILYWNNVRSSRVKPKEYEIEWVSFENEYSISLFNYGYPAILKGRIDGIVRYNGKYYLWEHKVLSNPDTLLSTLDFAQQPLIYMWAVQQHLNVPLEGVIYNIIVPITPKEPELLKNGEVSKNKTIRCTSVFYETFVINTLGSFDPKYSLVFEELEHVNDPKFFQRYIHVPNEYQINCAKEYLLAKVEEILNPKTIFYPTDSPYGICQWCSFKTPCSEMSKYGKSDFSMYRTKVKRLEQ